MSLMRSTLGVLIGLDQGQLVKPHPALPVPDRDEDFQGLHGSVSYPLMANSVHWLTHLHTLP